MNAIEAIHLRRERALVHMKVITDHVIGVLRSHEKAIRAEYDPHSRKYTLYTAKIMQADNELGVIIGEYVHHLRSILDNLVWGLACLRTDKPYWRGAFPVLLKGRRSGPKDKSKVFHSRDRGCGLDYLQSVSARHIRMIERFQPSKRGNGGRNCPLWLLSELNNWDKHRVIGVSRTAMKMTDISKDGMAGFIPGRIKVFRSALKDGSKLAEIEVIKFTGPHTQIQFDLGFQTEVKFSGGSPDANGLLVVPALTYMGDAVLDIIEAFSSEF